MTAPFPVHQPSSNVTPRHFPVVEEETKADNTLPSNRTIFSHQLLEIFYYSSLTFEVCVFIYKVTSHGESMNINASCDSNKLCDFS
jgi:hypothetical protein